MDHYNNLHHSQQSQQQAQSPPSYGGRPQPTPHQHPHAHYHPHSQQQFALPPQHHSSHSYASSSSASDWDMRANSFFSDSGLGGGGTNSGSGSGEYSEPSSVGSFSHSGDGMGGKGFGMDNGGTRDVYSPASAGPVSVVDSYNSFSSSFAPPRFNSQQQQQQREYRNPDDGSYEPYSSHGLGLGSGGAGSASNFQEMMSVALQQQGSGSRRNSYAPMEDVRPGSSGGNGTGVVAAYATFATPHDPSGPIGMMGPPPRPSQSRFSSNSGLILAPSTVARHQQQQQQQQQSSSHIYSAYQSSSSSSFIPPSLASSAQQQQQQVSTSPIMSPQASYANKLAPPSPSSFSMNPTAPSEPFNASALGLPSLPSSASASLSLSNGGGGGGDNWSGVYSTTGFDMVAVLARVAARPNPQIALGPVDLGCSFVVVDARKWDQPIVFASETFSRLTGYSNAEIIGRNCRFLQAPDGVPVRQGEKRKYTDGNAAHHLRRHLIQGYESQASLINYCKGGKPFINLVTIVPITWDDSTEIAYYVGFQVDLVEQPSAIMEKMRDGSYVVNYSLSVNSIPATLELPHVEPFGDHNAVVTPKMEVDHSAEIIDTIAEKGIQGLMTDQSRKGFNRLLLEHCDDFVHVLSLKGSLLYVSPSAKRMLEYDPSELTGKALSSICHPSDIVSVLRELKEAGPNAPVNIVYRVRRKKSGYVWLEATGKLHLEQGKGRKCVILVGRPREVYRMSWSDLERLGGFGATEYWSKITVGGLYLYATPAVDKVLGLDSESMNGKTVAQLSPGGDASAVLEALQQASKGAATTVRHQMLAKSGVVDVVTHFYPARSETDAPASPLLPGAGASALTVIAQTNLFSSEVTKPRNVSLPSAPSSRSSTSSSGSSIPQSPIAFTVPSFTSQSSGSDGDESSSGGSSGATSFSAIQSTFKQLTPSASVSDNVFDELDSVRGTSWQFELHQMRLTNKKLREEKEALLAMQRKKRKRAQNPDKLTVPGAPATGKNAKRSCANCGRSSSAEWRTGPTGPKTLCNACGLRWSKVRPQLASSGSSSSVNNHHTHLPSPATTLSDSSSSATPPLIPMVRHS